MWPFRATTGAKQDSSLEARLDDLEKRLEALDVEWSEWYDKYRRLYARIAKRVERDEKDAEGARPSAPPSRQDAPRATNGIQHTHYPAGQAPRTLRGF